MRLKHKNLLLEVWENIDNLRVEQGTQNGEIREALRIATLELESMRAAFSEIAVGYRHMQIVLRAIVLKEQEGTAECEQALDASTAMAEEDSTDPTDGLSVPVSE